MHVHRGIEASLRITHKSCQGQDQNSGTGFKSSSSNPNLVDRLLPKPIGDRVTSITLRYEKARFEEEMPVADLVEDVLREMA